MLVEDCKYMMNLNLADKNVDDQITSFLILIRYTC